MKQKCPICGHRASPAVGREPLRKFDNALRVLGLPRPYAHTSCVIRVLRTRVRTKGYYLRGASSPPLPSQLVSILEKDGASRQKEGA